MEHIISITSLVIFLVITLQTKFRFKTKLGTVTDYTRYVLALAALTFAVIGYPEIGSVLLLLNLYLCFTFSIKDYDFFHFLIFLERRLHVIFKTKIALDVQNDVYKDIAHKLRNAGICTFTHDRGTYYINIDTLLNDLHKEFIVEGKHSKLEYSIVDFNSRTVLAICIS